MVVETIQQVRAARLTTRLTLAGVILTQTTSGTPASDRRSALASILDTTTPILGEVPRTSAIVPPTAAPAAAPASSAVRAYARSADALLGAWAVPRPIEVPVNAQV